MADDKHLDAGGHGSATQWTLQSDYIATVAALGEKGRAVLADMSNSNNPLCTVTLVPPFRDLLGTRESVSFRLTSMHFRLQLSLREATRFPLRFAREGRQEGVLARGLPRVPTPS
jgi:hypothetical protein